MRDKGLKKMGHEEKTDVGDRGLSPLELMQKRGGKAHKVRGGMARRGADSMIAVYKDRFTYTFVLGSEVASIHYDKNRDKVFYSGHNIENMKLSKEQQVELMNVINILENDEEGKEIKDAYQATLSHYLADNK